MADYERPMSFTAVNANGRPPSPPRSHPAEQHRSRDSISNNMSSNASQHNSSSNSHATSISSTNGVYPPAETRRTTPPHAEDRERDRERAPPAYRASSAEREAGRPDPPLSDHNQSQPQGQNQNQNQNTSTNASPTRKRTYPEAFDETTAQQYPPRSAPPRDGPGPSQHPTAPSHYDSAPNSASNHYGNGSIHAGSPYSTDPGLDETDRRTMEALKANSGGTNSPPHDPYDVRDEDDDQDESPHGMGSMMSVGHTGNRTAAGVLTKDANKRKRVFSNRTKTGCLTCRKRKKKCDEKHPECNNCMRGGFVCEGYNPRETWRKPLNSQHRGPPSLAQLQSKGPGMTPQRQPSLHYPDTPQDFGRPELRHEDPRRDMPMVGPPPGVHSHPETMRQPYPGRDGRYPPAGEMGPRYEQDPRNHPLHNGAMHEHGYPPPPAPAFPSQHPAALHHASGPQAAMHPDPATQARAALEHVPSASLPPASTLMGDLSDDKVVTRRPGEPSERDKMLQGDYHLPYTPALMADRDQCAQAVYRFNQACQNPSLGFTYIDRERLFREIVGLQPSPDQPCVGSPAPPNPEVIQSGLVIPGGRIGPGVVVEAPFQCDYGYNLHIGANVVIGSNCRIADSCPVTIGSGAVLSPGVTLMCTTYGTDPKERRKGKGRALARAIVIGEDAWIGPNVTLLPGVKVGKCSTVGAGSQVHKDIPPYTIVVGNPPKVVRGIGSDDERERDRTFMP